MAPSDGPRSLEACLLKVADGRWHSPDRCRMASVSVWHCLYLRERFFLSLSRTLYQESQLLFLHTPHPRLLEVGPASMIVGNLVAGKRIAQASGRELAHLEDSDQARKVRPVPGSEEGAPLPVGAPGP